MAEEERYPTHLTPTGWIPGSEGAEDERPEGTLVTITRFEPMHMYGGKYYSQETWRDPKADPELIKALVAKYGTKGGVKL